LLVFQPVPLPVRTPALHLPPPPQRESLPPAPHVTTWRCCSPARCVTPAPPSPSAGAPTSAAWCWCAARGAPTRTSLRTTWAGLGRSPSRCVLMGWVGRGWGTLGGLGGVAVCKQHAAGWSGRAVERRVVYQVRPAWRNSRQHVAKQTKTTSSAGAEPVHWSNIGNTTFLQQAAMLATFGWVGLLLTPPLSPPPPPPSPLAAAQIDEYLESQGQKVVRATAAPPATAAGSGASGTEQQQQQQQQQSAGALAADTPGTVGSSSSQHVVQLEDLFAEDVLGWSKVRDRLEGVLLHVHVPSTHAHVPLHFCLCTNPCCTAGSTCCPLLSATVTGRSLSQPGVSLALMCPVATSRAGP
jgi:hypothetical protein